MDNARIARILEDYSNLLEISGANTFRVLAYRNAARTVEGQAASLPRMVERGEDLRSLPGIGKEIAANIREIVEDGELAAMRELSETVPLSLIELTRLPGLGPRRVKRLFEELQIRNLDDLEGELRSNRVAELSGFGKKSAEKIREAIAAYRRHRGRTRLIDAEPEVARLLEYLRATPGLQRLEPAGSFRRRRETVGDLDLLAESEEPDPLVERFTSYPAVVKILLSGSTRVSVVLDSGLQVDLRIVPPASFGAALVYFTGSKEHNVQLRRRGIQRGLLISEYGVFPRPDGEEGEPSPGRPEEVAEAPAGSAAAGAGSVAGRTEEEVYAAVGLTWIPPELREDRGEIEAAEADRLPDLLQPDQILGDLQMHSTWSDGRASIEEMLLACADRGYRYFALTDHSRSLSVARGLDADRLRLQWDEIQEVQSRHPGIRILRGMEVDILADGTLDLEEEMLAGLDFVLASVHTRFELPEAEQTKRVIRALRHPAVDALAHPTARMVARREPIRLDLEAVFQAAAETGTALELNAHPSRLDLSDLHLMEAKRRGVKLVISTDAHSVRDLAYMRCGIEQARRAWLTRQDVLNCLPLDQFLAALKPKAGREAPRSS